MSDQHALSVVVVGAGMMGDLHARTVTTSRQARLVGVVDVDHHAAARVSAELGVAAFTDLEPALARLRPDAVIIATPDSAHRDPAEAAIASGAAVLVEKPLATTVEDAEAIVSTAERHGVRLMTGHISRFYARRLQLAQSVLSGRLGEPLCVTTQAWGLASLGARVVTTTDPLWHFAIHDIDQIHWITGGVIDVVDGAQFLTSETSDLGVFLATGRVTTGAAFQIATGWTYPDSAGPRWDLTVHCEGGVAQAVWTDDGVAVYTADGVDRIDCLGWPTLNGRIEGALRLELEHFFTAVLEDTAFVITPREAVDLVRSAALLEARAVRRAR